jgi:peptidyl-prolyl cis-trans isomerase C
MRFSSLALTLLLTCSVALNAQSTPAAKPKTPTPAAKPKAPTPATTPKTPAPNAAADPVVLTVGAEKMTKSQFEAFVAALPEQVRAGATGPNKRKFAEQVVEVKALAYEARRRKLDQSPEVKQRIALQTDSVLASEVFRLVNADVKVDDAALRSYYDQHKSEYEQAKANHILIRFKGSSVPLKPGQKELTEEEALAKAQELREKIVKGGGDFATIAKAESDDAGSGPNGGALGSFARGRMVPAFDQAAFSLPIGQVSEPVKSPFGYHIIKVEERSTKTFEEMKPQLETQLKPELAKKALEEVRKTVPSSIDEQYFGK